MSKILGLDLGTNSIGWALVNTEQESIIDMGVRVFPEGIENIATAKEQSKNFTRREKRQIRRQLHRRRLRKYKLLNLLKEWNIIQSTNLDDFKDSNPYNLRAKGLDEKLSLLEFARVLYHLSQRRGFRSSRKEGSAEENNDKSPVKSGISELAEQIKKSNFRTIGEYFYSVNPHEVRIRGRYTSRSMFIEEFNLLWDKQSEFYPDLLTDDRKQFLRDKVLFFQRPLRSVRHLVGKCKFEIGKKRALRHSFEFQEFRMLQQVNQLRIAGGIRIDDDSQQLTLDERERLIKFLSENSELKFDKTLKKFKQVIGIDKNSKTEYKVNIEHLGKLNGLDSLVKIKKALGKRFNDFDQENLEKLRNTLHFAENNDWLSQYLAVEWNLDSETIEKLSKIKIEKDYASLSQRAIKKLLPHMREGLQYHEACEKVGYEHNLFSKEVEIYDELPAPNRIANPIVMSALHQLRKVVNDIVKHYGKPDQIKIEVAREMKMPAERRKQIFRNNLERQKLTDSIKLKLKNEFNISNPSRDDILIYKLLDECGHICPFTGKSIEAHQLFDPKYSGEVHIEHILPYSRTLDDSFGNKTLCYHHENVNVKKNMSPYEAYHQDEIKYKQILERVKSFPFSKAKKFQQKTIETDSFISRQLNDTSYIAKESVNYLKHLVPNVDIVTGHLTSTLRRYWGLNPILAERDEFGKFVKPEDRELKNREDHRHHSIDALVIALTTRSYLQKIHTIHAKGQSLYTDRIKELFPRPWENLNQQAEVAVANIIISHKQNKRVRGQLHEETLYGQRFINDGNSKHSEERLALKSHDGKFLFAVRKPIESLTTKEIFNIIDAKVRELILNRLQELGVDITNPKFTIPKNAFNEPIFMFDNNGNQRYQIKKARVNKPMTNSRKLRNYNIHVEPGNNHHIVIYSEENKVKGKVVPLFDVVKRKAQGLPPIDKELAIGQEYIMSLQAHEMVINGEPHIAFDKYDKSTYHFLFDQVYRVQKMDVTGTIAFRKHNVAILSKKDSKGSNIEPGRLFVRPSTCSVNKINVSPAGFIEDYYE